MLSQAAKNKLTSSLERHKELEAALGDSSIHNDREKLGAISKEFSPLSELAAAYAQYEKSAEELRNCRASIETETDPDMAAMYKEEIVDLEAAEVGHCKLRFDVDDTGIGVPEDKLEEIFEPFAQADSSNTRKFGGSGLGLAICRELAALMGGDLSMHSEPGRGSRFSLRVTFELPEEIRQPSLSDAIARHAALTSMTRPQCRPLRILLADDNKVNQRVTVVLLEKRGHSVVVADNGRDAVEAFSKHPFDLILMDVQMPELDGLQATAHIRQLEKDSSWKRVPIIALTAHATREDEDRCLAATMDGFLTKPVRPSKLLETIALMCA